MNDYNIILEPTEEDINGLKDLIRSFADGCGVDWARVVVKTWRTITDGLSSDDPEERNRWINSLCNWVNIMDTTVQEIEEGQKAD